MPYSSNKEKSFYDVGFASACSKSLKGKNGLNRAEFIELMVRISVFKYVNTKIAKTPVQALKKFLTDDILPDWQIEPTW